MIILSLGKLDKSQAKTSKVYLSKGLPELASKIATSVVWFGTVAPPTPPEVSDQFDAKSGYELSIPM